MMAAGMMVMDAITAAAMRALLSEVLPRVGMVSWIPVKNVMKVRGTAHRGGPARQRASLRGAPVATVSFSVPSVSSVNLPLQLQVGFPVTNPVISSSLHAATARLMLANSVT
jgi:hypothetical protein